MVPTRSREVLQTNLCKLLLLFLCFITHITEKLYETCDISVTTVCVLICKCPYALAFHNRNEAYCIMGRMQVSVEVLPILLLITAICVAMLCQLTKRTRSHKAFVSSLLNVANSL